MKHLLFFDIDGTLAIGKDVPDSAARAISLVRDKGDLVFICTGRNIVYVQEFFSAYADGFITNNGRLAYYEDRIIFDQPIAREKVKTICERLEDQKAGVTFYSKQNGFYEGPDDLYEQMQGLYSKEYVKKGIPETEDYYNLDLIYYNVAQIKEYEKLLNDLCILNPHDPHPSADISVWGCDKGDALKAVMTRLDIARENVYAFGDGMNDIGMLKAAGHGIAMGNGQKQAKAAAEYVTDDIFHDGIWNAMKHYELL